MTKRIPTRCCSRYAVLFLLCAAIFPLCAEVTFSAPDLNGRNDILFAAKHRESGETPYVSLFTANLAAPDADPRLITCFPEQLSVIEKGALLRIRNRYGVFHYSDAGRTLSRTAESGTGEPVPSKPVRLDAESVSPDGKWICSIKKTGIATGTLTLKTSSGYSETELAQNVELNYDEIPVSWSPDSSLLIYEKNGALYFTDPAAAFKTSQIPEYLRRLGTGTVHSIAWASAKNLVYISNDLVYKIPVFELYTRSLYADFVGTGTIIGRLPVPFTGRDRFSVSDNCGELVLIRNGRAVYYVALPQSADFTHIYFAQTFTPAAGESIQYSVFWTADRQPVVWFEHDTAGEKTSRAFKLIKNETDTQAAMSALPLPENVSAPLVSPDGKRFVCASDRNAYAYLVHNWEQTGTLSGERIVSYVWADPTTLFVGGEESVRKWKVAGENGRIAETLFLSAAELYAWNPETNAPSAQIAAGIFDYDGDSGTWSKSAQETLPPQSVKNGVYRVFLGTSPNADFTNAVYVRSLTGPAVTAILYAPAGKKNAPRPKIALTFDALDNADGLTPILQALAKYGLPATFFINGEFLRRYPAESKLIAQKGHECASMFHSAADLTAAAHFIVDEPFVRRGLARSEDEFFASTGYELALLWHAPFYKANDLIIQAGNKAGYKYVDRTLAPADGVTLEEAVFYKKNYLSASKLIEQLIPQLGDGAILPVSVGMGSGTRGDYLYDKTDLLISAILAAGYDIVPVSGL